MASNCATPMEWQRKWISDLFEVRAAGDIEWSQWNRDHDSNHPFPVYANGRSDSGLHGYASYAVEQGDAITLTARGTSGELGFAFLRTSAFTPIGRLLILRPKGQADAGFFTNYINGVVRFPQENTGVAQLTAPQVTRCEVDVPPLPEQRAIAAVLYDVDTLIAGLERLIAKKRGIKQAAMHQLLTGQTRLPGFSGTWEKKRLGDVGDCLRGVAYRGDSDLFSHDTEQTKRLLRSNNVQEAMVVASDVQFVNAACVSEHQILRAGDVLICMANGSKSLVGKAGYFDRDDGFEYTFGAFMGAFRCSDFAARRFVFYLFQTGRYRDHINNLLAGSSINNLSPASVLSLEFSFPEKGEQTAIATVLSDMDAELSALESRLAKTRAIKQGMMQELLTGRTRLVDSVEQAPAQKTEPTDERKANVHFMRSVLAAEIVDQLHNEPTFGHVKFEKMMFLAEHLCQVDTGSHYARKAAGPLDRQALHSIDSQLRKQAWFDVRKENGRYRYVPLEKRGGHQPYFDRYFAPIRTQLSEILETFRNWETERCEIVATLYAAWNDLLKEKDSVSDDLIVHEVLNNWHESKQRIPEERWLKALGWMREKGYVPGPVAEPNSR